MTDETEPRFLLGEIWGYVLGIASQKLSIRFDRKVWEDHYGSIITANTIPIYPSREAFKEDRDVPQMGTYDHDTEQSILLDGAELPDDNRFGVVVFADGTAAIRTRAGNNFTIELTDQQHRFVESLSQRRLKILREVSDYDSKQGAT
jgi:hypothetical protein